MFDIGTMILVEGRGVYRYEGLTDEAMMKFSHVVGAYNLQERVHVPNAISIATFDSKTRDGTFERIDPSWKINEIKMMSPSLLSKSTEAKNKQEIRKKLLSTIKDSSLTLHAYVESYTLRIIAITKAPVDLAYLVQLVIETTQEFDWEIQVQ